MNLIPKGLRGYQRSWLVPDIIAGVTLAAVAIPETMGYTSISQTPIVTGLYTVIFPTIVFALIGSSRLLVVGADSATAAILSAGLISSGIAGVSPYSSEWLAYCGLIALMCGGMLLLARIFKLGFIGDFLSSSVLIGFLTGVGVQVLSGQIPDMLGVPKGTGNWFQQQWAWITELTRINWWTFAFAAATLLIILGFKRFLPRIPGAIIAVILSIAVSAMTDASSHGVAVVGSVTGGFPPIGLPQGISLDNFATCLAIAFSCFVLIIAQSAATSRSFAMKLGQKVDVNRDIVGLSGSSFAAGLSGTFVVNGSPTKTQILYGLKGRTQLANITMSLIVLLVVMFFTSLLTDMPKAVLGAIVFLIGVDLVDIAGLRGIWRVRRGEAIIAIVTAAVVCAVGVEQGIILAIVLSIIGIIERQYKPKSFLLQAAAAAGGPPTFAQAKPGDESLPGLVVFRYDAELFYANANRFVDDVEALFTQAPTPVRWLALDCSSIDDIDWSAGNALSGLVDFVHAKGAHFCVVGADPELIEALKVYGISEKFQQDKVFATFTELVAAFRAEPAPPATAASGGSVGS